MKNIAFIAFICLSIVVTAQIPFHQFPDFETTPDDKYGTGLGIADINNDGWKDIIVANGNDILRQHLEVYYNQGDGTFHSTPDWESDDIDYHGHLSAGDIDNDGDVDIAVSVYLGVAGFSSPGKIKVYYNTGSELESIPSFQSDPFYTFSCALGDADGDGDLDIAAACGESYGEEFDNGRIFYNDNGSFNSTAEWESNIEMGALDVEFADIDQNGYLDLIFVNQHMENYVFLADISGNIDEDWDWHSDHPLNYINSLDFGKPSADADPCVVMTGNDQLGGDGKIKQFSFPMSIPLSSPPSWESSEVGYGSGILLAEINNDENLDLLYGSWWGPLGILEGNGTDWNNTPVYTSARTSVVESILMSDLGKFNYQMASKAITPSNERAVFYLDQQIIEKINSVYVNTHLLPREDYCYVELKNWVSLKEPITNMDAVVINYEYMKNGDVVISNWDPGKGNFIYYNTNNPVGIAENLSSPNTIKIDNIYPQPANSHIDLAIHGNLKESSEILIHDLSGKLLYSLVVSDKNLNRIDVSHLSPGMYLLSITNAQQVDRRKLLIAR